MDKHIIASGKTAIVRAKGASAPLLWLLEHKLILPTYRILDFGAGKGGDVRHLRSLDYSAYGYDPIHGENKFVTKIKPTECFDLVISNYVLNTLPIEYQGQLIDEMQKLAPRVIISIRNDIKKEGATRKGTYQRKVELPFSILHKTSSYVIYAA